MWNWKCLYEDEDIVCYCDIDSIADSEEDEDGFYRSVECYRAIPTRVAAWMSFFFKDKKAKTRYVGQRKQAGLPIAGYEDFSNTLCVVEIDAAKKMYRVIPAIDYDSKGNELGQSTTLEDEGKIFFKTGMKVDWAPLQPRKTHKAIHALFTFIHR